MRPQFTNIRNKLDCLSGELLEPNQMFVGKASNLPWSGASFKCTTQVGSGLNCKR
jgi:hypothetical protein